MSILKPLLSRIRGLWRDERGITGLETSIMLIAFVVVASVFAFAVLRMGIFTAGETEKAVTGVFGETTSILALRGSVVAHKGEGLPLGGYVKSVSFEIEPQSLLGHTPTLSGDEVIVHFMPNESDCLTLQFDRSGPQPGLNWRVDWINGEGPVLSDINAPAEFTLTMYGLRKKLGTTDSFSMAIKPKETPLQECGVPREGGDTDVMLPGDIDLGAGTITSDVRPVMYVDGDTVTHDPSGPVGDYVGHLTFLVHNSSPSGTIDLSPERTVVSYYDSVNPSHSDLPYLKDIANTQVGLGWGILGDSGSEIDSDERADIQINLFGLETLLGPGDEFTIEIRPLVGSALTIEKKLPGELEARTRLD